MQDAIIANFINMDTVGIRYCDYHPVTHIWASDTILPIPNLAKNAILLLKGYRLVKKYHLVTICLSCPEVFTISDTYCISVCIHLL